MRARQENDLKGARWFISRPSEADGIKPGAWKYWKDEQGDIIAMQRIEGEKEVSGTTYSSVKKKRVKHYTYIVK